MDRTLYDGKSLYDYYIDDDRSCPVLVIRDLSDEPGVPRCLTAYRTLTNNIGRVVCEIEFQTGLSLSNTAAIYRDTQGHYDGIDLIGTGHRIFSVFPGLRITDEALAVTAVREIHSARLSLLNIIQSRLPMGRIEQFSRVEISIGGACYSYWVPGYPSKELVMDSKSYKDILKEHPQAEICTIEVVSHLIHREASPASKELMQAMTAYDINLACCLDNVSMGDAYRHIAKLDNKEVKN